MTTQILLIRHGAHEHVGKVLSGRMPGLGLANDGRAQAAALATSLSGTPLSALHASPVQRARETAMAIAAVRRGLAIEEAAALDEIDFGTWTGRSFAELESDPDWRRWNEARGDAAAPGGESMAAAQERAWAHLAETATRHPGGTVAMVSHCDIVRAVIVRILGLPLGAIHRFEIAPASVSRVELGSSWAKVLSLNEVVR